MLLKIVLGLVLNIEQQPHHEQQLLQLHAQLHSLISRQEVENCDESQKSITHNYSQILNAFF